MYVEIALYLINLHSVDLKAGTFHADFYLYFKGMYLERTESLQVRFQLYAHTNISFEEHIFINPNICYS